MNIENQPIIVRCPTCQKGVVWTRAEKFKPFCSERCKLIDLGEWAEGGRAIPGEPVVEPEEHSYYLH
jgi:endogenous inhibitor of DNA gyrase (YacG/DUF329 family)